jgi:DNA-binding NarL/FixJ family response regulator
MVESETCVYEKRLKIAIVEDSAIIVSRVHAMISELNGVDFLGDAPSVDLALKMIDQSLPDVMIIDISLKDTDGRNGITLLQQVKKENPAIVVIMLTNLSDWLYRTQCATGGADFFFDKSNDFEKIPETLAAVARRRVLM